MKNLAASMDEHLNNLIPSTIGSTASLSILQEATKPMAQIDLKVATNKLAAYVRVTVPDDSVTVSVQDIVNKLNLAGIVYGIDMDAIHKFVENKAFFYDIKAAAGDRKVDGIDGKIVYNFKQTNERPPKERPDGTVDYRELGMIQTVEKDEVIASIEPPTEGKSGTDVYGNPIPYKDGVLPAFEQTENTYLSSNKLLLKARIDGNIVFVNGLPQISNIYIVNGNVDSATGNLYSKGSILVNGDVTEGFMVQADNHITIRGSVEGAMLTAGGDITITNGVSGMGTGTIQAGGDIISKFIESANIVAQGNVYADVVMNSKIIAFGSIALKGGKGRILGGICKAGRSILANTLGTDAGIHTQLIIDSEELRRNMLPDENPVLVVQKIKSAMLTLMAECDEISTNMQHLVGQSADPRVRMLIKNMMTEKNTKSANISVLQEQLKAYENLSNALLDYKIVAFHECQSGVKLKFADMYRDVENESYHVKYYVDDNRIVEVMSSPNDHELPKKVVKAEE